MNCKALVHANGQVVLRALTSEKYTRFWNWEVFDRLCGLEADGWRTPPGRPAGSDVSNVRRATEADCLQNRKGGGGLAIQPGDLIAPAGVYASDHDMFAFMVNEEYRIEDGSDGGLSRGFFVQNSEVGASALKVTFFHYRHVCGNHIVWDASNVIEVAVRHIGDVAGRFHIELGGAVQKYLAISAKEETERVQRAKECDLGRTKDEVLDTVFRAVSGGRRAGLPSGLNFKQLGAAYDLAEQHYDTDGSPRTVWGYVNGLTRLSQQTGYTDDRTFLDRAASGSSPWPSESDIHGAGQCARPLPSPPSCPIHPFETFSTGEYHAPASPHARQTGRPDGPQGFDPLRPVRRPPDGGSGEERRRELVHRGGDRLEATHPRLGAVLRQPGRISRSIRAWRPRRMAPSKP